MRHLVQKTVSILCNMLSYNCMYNPKLHCKKTTIGHFRFTFSLFLKVRLDTHPIIWKQDFSPCKLNSLQWLCTRPILIEKLSATRKWAICMMIIIMSPQMQPNGKQHSWQVGLGILFFTSYSTHLSYTCQLTDPNMKQITFKTKQV